MDLQINWRASERAGEETDRHPDTHMQDVRDAICIFKIKYA